MTDYADTAAYRRGVVRAEAEMAKAPPDDTVTITLDEGGGKPRREVKLCRRCQNSQPGRCCFKERTNGNGATS